MTNEERDIISQFVARIGGAPAPSGALAGSVPTSSVPATATAPLAPVDRDADTLIGQLFQRYPEAQYRMTQLAFVQEQGLVQAQNRIAAMEAELHRAQQALQQAQQQQQPQQPQGGGGSLQQPVRGRLRPQPAPPPSPGPWGGAGSPHLHKATRRRLPVMHSLPHNTRRAISRACFNAAGRVFWVQR